ncbi:AAA family ATPase [Mycolicibacterium tokaiense]|uniref:Tunicamycin resistance protein n=1 Tax=Mycolicibacterium tokaiense TaxID=39695 RepID=A0A378TF14_9MYCO|nr:AAA family ATPase [Mycolicibacterium tokaiense]BBY86085.1 tunicamycin resistance protein [Mycolicibacterium tokaiense]STZ59402.1 Tunicamycin resistance protein [Mycolicibacterium tokaiense]
MLIWINGAFGAGKTHTAHELHRRLPGSHVADPELIGFAMHKMLPAAARDDFQDLPGWRAAVVATLRATEQAADGPVIVPMTIVRADYFDEIVGALRTEVDLRHVTLVASPATLQARLGTRLEALGSRVFGGDGTWAMRQIDRCVTELADPRFATHVPTDDRTLDQVVEAVADDVGLKLGRPRLSPMRFQLHRLSVAARHIRV